MTDWTEYRFPRTGQRIRWKYGGVRDNGLPYQLTIQKDKGGEIGWTEIQTYDRKDWWSIGFVAGMMAAEEAQMELRL